MILFDEDSMAELSVSQAIVICRRCGSTKELLDEVCPRAASSLPSRSESCCEQEVQSSISRMTPTQYCAGRLSVADGFQLPYALRAALTLWQSLTFTGAETKKAPIPRGQAALNEDIAKGL